MKGYILLKIGLQSSKQNHFFILYLPLSLNLGFLEVWGQAKECI